MGKLQDFYSDLTLQLESECELTDEQVSHLTKLKDKELERLRLLCISDLDENNQVNKAKLEIYQFYAQDINDLVNKYEVFYHNLAESASVMIAEIVEQLSELGGSTLSEEAQLTIVQRIHKMEYVLYCLLSIELMKYYLKRAKKARRILWGYNINGVTNPEGQTNYKVIIKNKLSSRISEYKIVREKFKSFFTDSKAYNWDKILEIDGLETLFRELEDFFEEIETLIPTIMDSGVKVSAIKRILSVTIYMVIPVVLAAITIYLWLKGGK